MEKVMAENEKKKIWILSLVCVVLFAVMFVIGIITTVIDGGDGGMIVLAISIPMFITSLFIFLYCKRDTYKRLYFNYIFTPVMVFTFSFMVQNIGRYGREPQTKGYLVNSIVYGIFLAILLALFLFNIIFVIVKNHK